MSFWYSTRFTKKKTWSFWRQLPLPWPQNLTMFKTHNAFETHKIVPYSYIYRVLKGYLSFFFWWRFCDTLDSEAVQSITENATQNKRKYERYYLISYFSHFFLSKKSHNSFLRPKIACNFCMKFKVAFWKYVCSGGKMKYCQKFASTAHYVFFRIKRRRY